VHGRDLYRVIHGDRTRSQARDDDLPDEIPEPRIRQVARSLAAALRHVHSLGLAFRDLKPENVLCCEAAGGRDERALAAPLADVKLCDFGFAVKLAPGLKAVRCSPWR
jgi:serine/threonine protein kinase